MPDAYQQVFADLDRSAAAGFPSDLPQSGFDPQLFRMVYNERFATVDYMIVDEGSEETQALLPALSHTMEIVGDDSLNLTYDEWVYLTTGWYPKNNKTMSLGSRVRKMNLAWVSMLMDTGGGTSALETSEVDAYGKFVARHNFGWNSNLICVEPSFLVFVAGIWEQPNSKALYSQGPDRTETSAYTVLPARSARTGTGLNNNNNLDQGADFDFNQFRNAEAWLADPSSVDPLGSLGGSGAQERHAVQYWLGGEQRFSRDYDPFVLQVSGMGTEHGFSRHREQDEGSERFVCDLNFYVGLSSLQGFPDLS